MGLFKDCGCGCNGKKQEDKFIISIISGLTFFVIANPETFRLVRRVLGPSIATPNGCPSTFGLVVHTIVFTLIVWAMMNVKKEGGKKKSGCGCGGKKGTKVVHSVEPDTDVDEPVIELKPQGLNSEGTLY
tara:strand:- start:668 stop:1057 length:390 start_codon:yes stop_codon:yes gene_type:complete